MGALWIGEATGLPAESSGPAAGATILPLGRSQPEAIDMELAYIPRGNGPVATAILRHWEPGDTDRCGLCPASECNGRGRTACLVVTLEAVAEADAWAYSTVGRGRIGGRRPRPAPGGPDGDGRGG
jgi:hypothetical protein